MVSKLYNSLTVFFDEPPKTASSPDWLSLAPDKAESLFVFLGKEEGVSFC